tara:strand:+ start:884 stop:1117 length:234 start_codon:yes stop_codon:yes gene_type:complete
MRLKISEIIKEMTRDKITELHGLASNGIIRPELAANMLSEVCEAALELFKIVEQQKVQLEKYQRALPKSYDPTEKTP